MKPAAAEIIFAQLTQAFALSQDFARHDIVRRQTALLERLVRHADANVPFYRDSKRLRGLFRADGAFDLSGWDTVPVLTRNEAREHQDALQARNIPPEMGALEARSTSGSTGTPLKFSQTLVQRVASEALINRALKWHGLWPIQRIAVPGGPATAGYVGPNMLKIAELNDSSEQTELLRSHRITHVIAPPSVAARWAGFAKLGDLPDLTTIVACGEVLRPEVRVKIERQLKVKVINLYSTSELGPIACEGPDGRLRVNEETVLLEGPPPSCDVKDPLRVITTPLYAFGTPLIRYAPGDYVRFAKAPSRGAEGLRRLSEVIGRQRNLLRNPDGGLFLPGNIVARRLEAILDFREWQLVQPSLTDLVFKIVVPKPPSSRQWDDLIKYIKSSFPKHNVSVVIVDKIENEMENGKAYEMFLSLIE